MKNRLWGIFLWVILNFNMSYSNQKCIQEATQKLVVSQQKLVGKNLKKIKLVGLFFVGSSLAFTAACMALNDYVDKFFL